MNQPLCSVRLTTILPLSRQCQQLQPESSGSQSVTSESDSDLGFFASFPVCFTVPYGLLNSCWIQLSCQHQGLWSDKRERVSPGDLEQLAAMLWAKRGTGKYCVGIWDQSSRKCKKQNRLRHDKYDVLCKQHCFRYQGMPCLEGALSIKCFLLDGN